MEINSNIEVSNLGLGGVVSIALIFAWLIRAAQIGWKPGFEPGVKSHLQTRSRIDDRILFGSIVGGITFGRKKSRIIKVENKQRELAAKLKALRLER